METKGLKIQKHVKTRWISMLAPLQRIMAEFRPLHMTMFMDIKDNGDAQVNYGLLCDIHVVLGLATVIPILEACNNVIKFGQDREVFVCDMSVAVKVCQGQLCTMYTYPTTAFFGG